MDRSATERLGARHVSAIFLLLCLTAAMAAQGPPASPQLHVLKITCGPAGQEVNGTFVLTEERSTFSRADDREVIVSFLWDGTAGPHKLVATWRSPDGSTSASSAIDYVARDRRFGAYWRFTLSPGVAVGSWSIEVTVDGQPAGRYTFDVTDAKVSAGLARKKPLDQAQLYQALSSVFVRLQRSTSDGRDLPATAGFADGSRIYTTSATIDEVDAIAATREDSQARAAVSVVAWNRREQWALLAAERDLGAALPVAAPADVAVGDRCYSMEATGAGRILLEGSITGRGESAGTAVPHWVATFFTGPGTPGAPVLNQFGEVLGIIGAATVSSPLSQRLLLRMQADLKGSRVVPLGAFSAAAGVTPTPLAELRARGDVVPLVTGERHVVSGGFGQGVVKQPFVQVADQREDFSRSEKSFVAWVSWSPVERLKGMITLRLYDDENKRVVDATPVKKDLRKRELVLTSWTVPVPQTPGIYRADVFLDQNIMWRGYVRITP